MTAMKTDDPMKYYLEAMESLNSWDISKTASILSLLKKVIELDPEFYHAYIALCNCYTWMGALHQISQKTAGRKVNEILKILKDADHNLPEYYTLIAKRNFWVEWNRATAIRNCNRAIEINPNCVDALILKGLIAASEGKGGRGLELLQRAERLAPLTNNLNYFIALLYMYMEQPQTALFYLDRNIEISPTWNQQYYEKVILLCRLGMSKEAETLIFKLENGSPKRFILILKAVAAAYRKNRSDALALISQVESTLDDEERLCHAYYSYLAELHLLLNDPKSAFDLLEQGIKFRSTPLIFINLNYIWDKYRCDHDFQKVTKSMFSATNKRENRYERSELSAERQEVLLKKLTSIMEQDKLWLDSSLSREQLACSLGITAHHLSQLLNSSIGSTFHNYCNRYRLNHFLEINQDPSYDSFTLLSKAFESGFGSKSTFNTFFKKEMGTTPSQYFKR